MTPPEQQIKEGLALLDWAAIARESHARTGKEAGRGTGNRPRSEKNECACRSSPLQPAYAPQAFNGEPLNMSNATSLAQFEPLRKALGAYSGKSSMVVNADIHKYMDAITSIITKLRSSDPDGKHVCTRDDIRTGIRATLLLKRLREKEKTSQAKLQQRPAWRI
jgi:hypothetical protein